jgi:hypothetical protein
MEVLNPSQRRMSWRLVKMPMSCVCAGILLFALLMTSCAHYPVNQPLAKFVPPSEERARIVQASGRSEDLFCLTFSGGTRRPPTGPQELARPK